MSPPEDFGTLLHIELERAVAAEVDRRFTELRTDVADRDSASPFLTIAEAAEWLRTSRGTIDNMLSAGKLTRHKAGSRTLIARDELKRCVQRDERRR